MNYNKYTFKQIVLYIINKINKQELGNVKLNKILWFSDLEKCKRHMKSKDINKLTHTKLWESLNVGEVMPVDVEALEYFVDNETKDSDIQWEKENNHLKNVG